MPIDPNIALGVRPLEVPDTLNQLTKATQLQVSQLQLEDLLNDRKEMLAFQRDTGLSTPQAIATLMRNPKTRGQAIELQMKYQQQRQADKFLRDRYPGLPSPFEDEGATAPMGAPAAAPTNALAAAPMEPTGAQVGGPIAAPNVMAQPIPAPRNAMAAPAAAPVNTLAAPAPSGRSRQELERTIELSKMNPYLAGAGEVAKLELAELIKASAPSEFEKLLTTSNLTDAEKMALRRQRATKEATHAPSAQQNVFAYTPASEEAQKDFIKSSRATYDSLKNAPSVLENIEEAKKLIPGAKKFMGPGGEPILQAASFMNNRFGTNIDTKGITDASELRSRLFSGVIENLRKLDAQPTAAQQQVLQDAIGNLGTDPNALPRVLDAYASTLRSKVASYNEEVSSAEQRGVKFPYKPQIKLPEAAPGAGAGAAPMYAVNPKTGERIMSTDGGRNWTPAR